MSKSAIERVSGVNQFLVLVNELLSSCNISSLNSYKEEEEIHPSDSNRIDLAICHTSDEISGETESLSSRAHRRNLIRENIRNQRICGEDTEEKRSRSVSMSLSESESMSVSTDLILSHPGGGEDLSHLCI